MRRAAMLLAAVVLLMSGPFPASPGPYKSGTVKVVIDPSFGSGTEWDTLFKKTFDKWTAFLADGSFFRSAAAEGLVHKFDASGKLVKTFGRKGQGPGDLQMPGALDVLDGKTLVVTDAGNNRLSLFDLEGIFLKTVKLGEEGSPTSFLLTLAALDGNKIACAVQEGRASAGDVIAARYRVFVKDLGSGRETPLAVFDWEKPQSKFMVRVVEWEPAVFLAAAGPGKVLVACSGSPEIAVYGFSGQKLSSFILGTERTRIEWKHLEFAMGADENRKGFEFVARHKSDIKLPEYLPYYSRLALDTDGTILVYDFNAARLSRQTSFKAYAFDGRLLASVKIDPSGYEPVMPVHFLKGFAYAYLAKTGADDTFVFARFRLAAD